MTASGGGKGSGEGSPRGGVGTDGEREEEVVDGDPGGGGKAVESPGAPWDETKIAPI